MRRCALVAVVAALAVSGCAPETPQDEPRAAAVAPRAEPRLYIVSENRVRVMRGLPEVEPAGRITVEELDGAGVEQAARGIGACGALADVTERVRALNGDVPRFLAERRAECDKIQGLRFPGVTRKHSAEPSLERIETGRLHEELVQLLEAFRHRFTCARGDAACVAERRWNAGQGDLADYLERRIRDAGRKRVAVSPVPTPAAHDDSLVATVAGVKPELPAVVIGAHFDTVLDVAGADDNGSGVVVLLEMLRVIRDAPLCFERPLHLAFFAAEELTQEGSGAVANCLEASLRVMLNIDMAGADLGDEQIYFVTRGDECHVNEALDALSMEIAVRHLGLEPSRFGRDWCSRCSDHWRFSSQGVPTVYVSDGAVRSKEKKNPAWHSACDTIDTRRGPRPEHCEARGRVVPDRLELFAKYALAFAIELAGLVDCPDPLPPRTAPMTCS